MANDSKQTVQARQSKTDEAVTDLPHRTRGASLDHRGRIAPGDRTSNTLGESPPRKRRFARRPRSVSRAREFVVGLLGPGVEAGVADDIRLCVSELVTNALRHTPPGREFLVCVLPGRDVLRVEVHDAGTGVPYLCAPAATDDRGRGLRLVDALADDWGVSDRAGPGKAVWAEFKVAGMPPAARQEESR